MTDKLDKLKQPRCSAINVSTMKLEHPMEAVKTSKYSCPDCSRDIKFCKGNINLPYFSHYKSTNPCNFFDKPSESEKHKNAKMLLFDRLRNRDSLVFYSECKRCKKTEDNPILYSENSTARVEYEFVFNKKKKVADVVLLNGDELEIVFEIYNTHKTALDARPEPWYEVTVDDMLVLTKKDGKYYYKCIKNTVCKKCIDEQNEEIKRLIEAKELYTKEWIHAEEERETKKREKTKEEQEERKRIKEEQEIRLRQWEEKRKEKQKEKREKERMRREEEDRISNKKALDFFRRKLNKSSKSTGGMNIRDFFKR